MEQLKNLPLVSIIVPVYNVEEYLNRCIQSLLSQTLKDIEIILVDDKSPDNCPRLCDELAHQDSRMRVIHKEKNEGLGMACNSGIEIARGEYIAFCDSDDWVEPDTYEILYHTARKYHADMVFSGIQRINEEGKITPMNEPKEFQVITTHNEILAYGMDMIANSPSKRNERDIAMSAKIVLYRLENITRNHLRFESERQMISEDLIWNLDNIAHSSCVVTVPKTFYYYYCNEKSITSTLRNDRFRYYKILTKELINRTQRLGYPSEVITRIQRMFLGYSRHRIFNICKSRLGRNEKMTQIREICEDTYLRTILKEYPIPRMPVVHLISALLIKFRIIYLFKPIL